MKVKVRIINPPRAKVSAACLQVTPRQKTAVPTQIHPPQHTPLLQPDYAGGYDHCLLELSDVLPDSLYSKLTAIKKK